MIQLESLEVENFRSIKIHRVDFAPITVLYGPNGSGKSSFLYSLLLMKNVILNLERKSGDFFNFEFTNLSNFRAVIFNHDEGEWIRLYLKLSVFQRPMTLTFQIHENMVDISVGLIDEGETLNTSVTIRSPFKSVGSEENPRKNVSYKGADLTITWEGIKPLVQPKPGSARIKKDTELASSLAYFLNAPIEFVRRIEMVPLQMGFSKGEHEAVTTRNSLLRSEDEVGTFLADGEYLQSSVNHYLSRITGRTLRVIGRRGEDRFSIKVDDQSTDLGTELVNDGFGINRVTWLLTLALLENTVWTFIEEPETHLHPSSVRELARVLVNLVRHKRGVSVHPAHDDRKRFLLTTHSEALVLALLAEVSRGNLKPDEVAFYLTTKEGKETKYERQEVNELGQVEGGLSSFMEGEMEDIAAFFEQKA